MEWFGFLILFGVICELFPCTEGAVFPPTNGSDLVFLPGSTARINWTFDEGLAVRFRDWSFTSTDGSFKELALASIGRSGSIVIETTLLEFAVEKPATLVLKNVNNSYDGKYKFQLLSTSNLDSEVVVIIVVTPNITISCSNPSTVNEDNNFTCLCKAERGRPTADVTWYDKNDVKISETGKGEQLLRLTYINAADGGTYTCKAQSHINATDEKSIDVKVRLNHKPWNTNVTFKPAKVEIGGSATITCESDGLPEPSYTIFHNGTEVSTKKTFTLIDVKYIDGGTYKCVAINRFGNSSDSIILTVREPIATMQSIRSSSTNQLTVSSTSIRATISASKTTKGDESGKISEKCSSGAEWYIIVVTLVSGIIIGILLSYIVFRSRPKFKNRKPHHATPEPPIDSTYQELDLSKMNREENYQSLRGNAARNDGVDNDDSTYTELNKTRDVEKNYQSLT